MGSSIAVVASRFAESKQRLPGAARCGHVTSRNEPAVPQTRKFVLGSRIALRSLRYFVRFPMLDVLRSKHMTDMQKMTRCSFFHLPVGRNKKHPSQQHYTGTKRLRNRLMTSAAARLYGRLTDQQTQIDTGDWWLLFAKMYPKTHGQPQRPPKLDTQCHD